MPATYTRDKGVRHLISFLDLGSDKLYGHIKKRKRWRELGAVVVPAGQSKQLGSVDVSPFSQIRVVADERAGSPTGISIRLTITEGNELVAQLDVLQLAPHSQVTRVYDVPGTKLTIFADAIGGTGSDGIDVLVYGS